MFRAVPLILPPRRGEQDREILWQQGATPILARADDTSWNYLARDIYGSVDRPFWEDKNDEQQPRLRFCQSYRKYRISHCSLFRRFVIST